MRGGRTKTKKAAKNSGTPRSTMGRLLPPVDITSESQLAELTKRITKGPLTLVFVYADWCGHCQRFKPTMDELEKDGNRSIQTARIRDDVFPKSQLSSAKIEGYPTLMLVENSGKVASFKTDSGQVTNAIPDYSNKEKMTALVRTAGRPEAKNLMNNSTVSMGAPEPSEMSASLQEESNATVNPAVGTPNIPKNIVADRLSASTVRSLNNTLVNSSNSLLKETAKPMRGGAYGGGLWGQLAVAAQQLAPAAALFAAGIALKNTRRRGKSRRRSGRRSQRK